MYVVEESNGDRLGFDRETNDLHSERISIVEYVEKDSQSIDRERLDESVVDDNQSILAMNVHNPNKYRYGIVQRESTNINARVTRKEFEEELDGSNVERNVPIPLRTDVLGTCWTLVDDFVLVFHSVGHSAFQSEYRRCDPTVLELIQDAVARDYH